MYLKTLCLIIFVSMSPENTFVSNCKSIPEAKKVQVNVGSCLIFNSLPVQISQLFQMFFFGKVPMSERLPAHLPVYLEK